MTRDTARNARFTPSGQAVSTAAYLKENVMLTHLAPECLRVTDRDGDALRAVFTGLSEGSRFLRFHTGVSRYPDSWWTRLGRVEPGVCDAALARVDGVPVGHGQWHVVSEGTADLALAVVDTWHRRGVGTALLDHLGATAYDAGLDHFTCWVHPENTPVREMLLSRGARLDTGTGAWVLDLATVCARVPSSHEAAA